MILYQKQNINYFCELESKLFFPVLVRVPLLVFCWLNCVSRFYLTCEVSQTESYCSQTVLRPILYPQGAFIVCFPAFLLLLLLFISPFFFAFCLLNLSSRRFLNAATQPLGSSLNQKFRSSLQYQFRGMNATVALSNFHLKAELKLRLPLCFHSK